MQIDAICNPREMGRMKHFGTQTKLVAAHESTTTKRMDRSENPSQGGSDLAYQVQ